jgi:hypothetical protein
LQSYDAKLAGNQAEITRLSGLSKAGQTRITELRARLATATTPKEREVIGTQIQAAVQAQQVVQVEIDGRQCMAVPVPQTYLADWNVAGLEVKP